jgi:phage-related protein
MTTWSRVANEVSATWSRVANEVSSTWSRASGEVSATWSTLWGDLWNMTSFVSWEGLDKHNWEDWG